MLRDCHGLFTFATANRTVPGTHPVEPTSKSTTVLHADYLCHLLFDTYCTLH